MPFKHTQEDGTEVEVYTADEVAARETAAVTAKETEFGKTRAQIEAERDEARTALAQRTGEFKQFRKLTDEQAAKLTVAERTIYENGLLLEEERQKNIEGEKKRQEAAIDTALKAISGTDEKLFTKMKEMWSVVNIEATTPEQIAGKAKMILGAIGQAEPDLVARINANGHGAYVPPGTKIEGDGKFGETEAGKSLAAKLNLKIEPPKKS